MFELNGSTLAGIGAILGALSGAVTFLFKQVVQAKDAHIHDLTDRVANLAEDRDYWRDVALGRVQTDKATWLEQRAPRRVRPASRD